VQGAVHLEQQALSGEQMAGVERLPALKDPHAMSAPQSYQREISVTFTLYILFIQKLIIYWKKSQKYIKDRSITQKMNKL
jgi:hypothetical protein